MLQQARLAKLFTQRNWQRGQAIFEAGLVTHVSLDDQRQELTGLVTNEQGDREYDVAITARDKKLQCLCSCPVGQFCQHAAAIVHAAWQDSTETIAVSDQQLSVWLEQPIIAPQPTTDSAKCLMFVLSTRPGTAGLGYAVSVFVSQFKKNGELSEASRPVHLPESGLHFDWMSQQERYLCADIAHFRHTDGCLYHADLLQRIVASGRAYWQQPHTQVLIWSEAQPLAFRWEVTENHFIQLKPVCGDVTQILATCPPCYLRADGSMGLLQSDVAAQAAQWLVSFPLIEAAQLSWILPKLAQRLGQDHPLLAKTPTLETSRVPEPKVCLSIFGQATKPKLGVVRVEFDYDGIRVNPTDPSPTYKSLDGKLIYRHTDAEQSALQELNRWGLRAYAPVSSQWKVLQHFQMHLPVGDWFRLLAEALPLWRNAGWQVEVAKGFYYRVIDTIDDIDLTISEQSNRYFSVAMQVEVEGQKIALLPLLQGALQQTDIADWLGNSQTIPDNIYVQLTPGQAIALSSATVRPLVQQFLELQLPNSIDKYGQLNLPAHRLAAALPAIKSLAGRSEKNSKIEKKLQALQTIPEVVLPTKLQATLRPYQREGLRWMQFLYQAGVGGLLADDMGLGKTLQVLAHLLALKEQNKLTQPALVLAPTSVIFNWKAEIKRFAPALTVQLLHGPKRGADADSLQNSDVIVTSYPLLLRDWNVYQQQLFSLLVLDEAQSLKNPSTKLYRVLQSLRFEQIIALSGTPIENHLGELWAQFNLLQPGLLGSQSQFNRLFRAPIERQRDEARRALLVERVRPFILRRQKQQIATELPGKTEILQSIPLEEKQAQLYESVRVSIDASLNKIIAAKGFKHSQIEILDAMLKLRQICCHPQLLNQVGAKRLSQSAKLDWLVGQLPGLLEDGRNILIFSQFSSMLGLIASTLDDMGIAYSKLTGETLDREAQIARFKQGKNRVFLISLKAGGTGLNLTEADTVIHFDPWWNPAAQAQATDRAYRIGQDKPVFVYRLIAQGSIEEKIVELQHSKQALAAGILDGSMDATETRLNEQMLQSLLAPLE